MLDRCELFRGRGDHPEEPISRIPAALGAVPDVVQVPQLPVYGVAIPTTQGLRLVLDAMGAAQGGLHACTLWRAAAN